MELNGIGSLSQSERPCSEYLDKLEKAHRGRGLIVIMPTLTDLHSENTAR